MHMQEVPVWLEIQGLNLEGVYEMEWEYFVGPGSRSPGGMAEIASAFLMQVTERRQLYV